MIASEALRHKLALYLLTVFVKFGLNISLGVQGGLAGLQSFNLCKIVVPNEPSITALSSAACH